MQNAFIERFNRTYREEVLDAFLWVSTQDVQQLSDACLSRTTSTGPTTRWVGYRRSHTWRASHRAQSPTMRGPLDGEAFQRTRSCRRSAASPARAPQLFAELHEAPFATVAGVEVQNQVGRSPRVTSPDCATCWTGRCRRAFTALGRSPIALLPFLAAPDRFMFLKPKVTGIAAERLAFDPFLLQSRRQR